MIQLRRAPREARRPNTSSLSFGSDPRFVVLSAPQQLEPNLRAHAERIAQLDVEVGERLQEACVLERPGVDGVEADVASESEHGRLRARVIAGDEGGELLVSE